MMTGNEYNDKANLNHEYMIVYQDMLRYLSSKDISLLVARDIRDDIWLWHWKVKRADSR